MLSPLTDFPSPLYEHLFAVLECVIALIFVGHGLLGLLRNYRNFRDGY